MTSPCRCRTPRRENGLASTAADALQAHGFNITSPDDYPGPLEHTTVFFSPGNEEAAATVASSFPDPTIERVNGLGDVVQVVLGSDFSAVGAPTPSGSTVKVHVLRGSKQHAHDTARGPDGHERGRHVLRVTIPSTGQVAFTCRSLCAS